MDIPILWIFSLIGFAAYEVGIRIIDEEVNWMQRIGVTKYIVYLVIFGGAVSIVATGLAYSMVPKPGLTQAFAVLLGMGLPSSIRLGSEVLARKALKTAKKEIDPLTRDENIDATTKTKTIEADKPKRVEEIKDVKPKYSKRAYLLGDIFGFSSRLDS